VVVPVPGVGSVPVAVVHVVGVITVWYGDVAAAQPVLVVMTLMGLVLRAARALVDMVAVHAVDVTVMDEVRVAVVRDRDVAAVLAVSVLVIGMRGVLSRTGHAAISSPYRCDVARRTAISFPA
jgi:hypothetical protein